MNILVTGGCGFIASNFIEYLFANHDEEIKTLLNIDCLNYCSSTRILKTNPEKYHFIKGNITNYDILKFILEKYEINTVVHLAAQSHVDNSFEAEKTLQYTIDNVLGTHTLMQACKDYGKVKKILHMSTDEVYGEVDLENKGCKEIDILNPTNPYAATKAGAEFIVRSYYHSYKMPVLIVRCNNVYGPHQFPEKLIPKFINLAKRNEKLTIHGRGDTRRNFIWVDDVSSALFLILQKGNFSSEIYNIGTENEYTVNQVADIILSFLKKEKDENKQFIEDRPFNDFRYAINVQKLKELGWEEKHTDFVENIKSLF